MTHKPRKLDLKVAALRRLTLTPAELDRVAGGIGRDDYLTRSRPTTKPFRSGFAARDDRSGP